MKIGYPCINITLAEQRIHVNRTMVKKTFLAKGIGFAAELALSNVQDLDKVIQWNIEHGILLYRMSSDMFPCMCEYDLDDLPNIEEIRNILKKAGARAKAGNLRLTFHPGTYNILASQEEKAVHKTIKELSQHAEIMDMLGLPENPYAKINLHIGSCSGDKISSLNKFAENFQLLPNNVRHRLTIENDDKNDLYCIKDLYWLHEQLKVPLVFDFLHHEVYNGGISQEEALDLVYESWPASIAPVVHYADSRRAYESRLAADISHADYLYNPIPEFKIDVDVMVEAQAKEKAVLKYIRDFHIIT